MQKQREFILNLFSLIVFQVFILPPRALCSRSGGRISSGGIRASRSARVMSAPRSAPSSAPSVTIIQSPPTTVIRTVPVPSYGYGGFGGGYYAPSYGVDPCLSPLSNRLIGCFLLIG